MAIVERRYQELTTAAQEYVRPQPQEELAQMPMDLGEIEYAEIPLEMSRVLTAEGMPAVDRERDARGRAALLDKVKTAIEQYRAGNPNNLPVTDETQIPGYILAQIMLPDQSIYGNPYVLIQVMEEIEEWLAVQKQTDGVAHDGHLEHSGTVTRRMAYNGKAPHVYDVLAEAVSYNKPVDAAAKAGNINLAWPEMRGFREATREVYRREPVTVLLPAATEPITGHRAIEYAADMTGGENVVAISAGFDETTTRRMRAMSEETGADMVMQSDILRAVNWQVVGERFGLPYDAADPFKPPAGTKGLTMLAGLLRAEAMGKLNQDVVFIDTDIVNQGEGGYDPLAYMAIPYIEANHPELLGVYNARTGPGRNNEPVTIALNHIAEDETVSLEIRKTAMMMAATMPWLLTGERRISKDVIRKINWVPNMGIEMQINAHLASMQVAEGRFAVAQVFDPNPKLEKGESVPSREMPLIDRCALHGRKLLLFCDKHGILPHQIGEKGLIAEYNREHGGSARVGFYQNEMHAPNTTALMRADYLMPSIADLRALEGAVDWDAIARAGQTQQN